MQVGNEVDRPFYFADELINTSSSWDNFPTDEAPFAKFKYTSIEINVSPDQRRFNRQTYALLDWLGDTGGLLDGLQLIAHAVFYPFTTFVFNSSLVKQLVWMRKPLARDFVEDRNEQFHLKVQRNTNRTFRIRERFKCVDFFEMWCRDTSKNRLYDRAHTKITRELDIRRVLHRLRMSSFVMLAQLSKEQHRFAGRMSRLIVMPSSSSDED